MDVPSTNECTHSIPSGAATEKDERTKSPRYLRHVDGAFASFFALLAGSQDGLSHLTPAVSRRATSDAREVQTVLGAVGSSAMFK